MVPGLPGSQPARCAAAVYPERPDPRSGPTPPGRSPGAARRLPAIEDSTTGRAGGWTGRTRGWTGRTRGWTGRTGGWTGQRGFAGRPPPVPADATRRWPSG